MEDVRKILVRFIACSGAMSVHIVFWLGSIVMVFLGAVTAHRGLVIVSNSLPYTSGHKRLQSLCVASLVFGGAVSHVWSWRDVRTFGQV